MGAMRSPESLGEATVRYVVLLNDESVPYVSATYWDDSLPHYRQVEAAIDRFVDGDETASETRARLAADVQDLDRHHQLARAVADLARRRPEAARELAETIARAQEEIRIDYHLGPGYDRAADPVAVDDLVARAAAAKPTTATTDPGRRLVHVVIPFRDRGSSRARNLMACLLSLRDQSLPAHRFSITVVESDDQPRWAEHIQAAADNYLFAERGGSFNKAWAVNVGVVNTPAESDLVCVLDADILPDREFLQRYAELCSPADIVGYRFHELYCLDSAASAAAIRGRCLQSRDRIPMAELRCHIIRPTPGACHWVKSDVFRAMNGLDERYQGWGREDNDFIARLAAEGTLAQSDEPLLHMEHDRPEMRAPDGTLLNLGIAPDWSVGDRSFGQLTGPGAD